nr:bcl-2-modifying factor isoform X5 [Anser cygnoides]
MDRPSYLEEDYSSLDGLDDDVFHSDDFGLAGNAGYRLHVPPVGFALDPHLQEEPQEGQQEARAEVQIARKLQCIADQFHRLHIQRVHVLPPCLLPTGWLRREHCLESKWSGKMPGGLPMLMTPSRGQLNLNQLIPFFPVHQT